MPRGRHGASLAALAALATATALAWASPARADCEIRGSIAGVRVRTDRGRHVAIRRARRVVVTPLRHGVFALRAEGSPALEGTVFAALPLRVGAAGASVAEGTVTLPPGTPIARADLEDEELAVHADLGGGVWLRRARVACDALEVAAGEILPGPAEAPPRPSIEGAPWHARRARLSVFRAPSAELPPVVIVVEEEGALLLRERARRDGYVELRARTASGAELRGWAREGDLVPAARER